MSLADEIRARLESLEDPTIGVGFKRARLVRDVSATDDDRRAKVTVGLVAPGHPGRDELEQRVRKALSDLDLDGLEVAFELAVPDRPPKPGQRPIPGVKHVLAVAAGKGGVGKSTVSTNLAFALHRLGARVGLMDADIYGPSLPKMLGEPDREVGKAPEGEGIAPALYRGMPAMSVDYFVEPGRAVIWRGPMIHKLLRQFAEDVRWGDLDALVVDLPPGTGDAQISLCQLVPVSGAVIVTTPQEVALLDVRKAIDMFRKLEVPVLGVVENMSLYRCPSCGHAERVFGEGGGRRLAEEFDLPFLGELPLDPRIAAGGEAGTPIVEMAPDDPVADAFAKVAANVMLSAAKEAFAGPRRSAKLRPVS
ncbi:MAG: MRP family ATP-binding protein [Deltaproteobacteria bacterium]|nr:MAG: MRP family ATP-binding protein [Deltaproteobacteria bacterium]